MKAILLVVAGLLAFNVSNASEMKTLEGIDDAVVLADNEAADVRGTAWGSGNPYTKNYSGQCTWYVWGKEQDNGWKIAYTGGADGYWKNAKGVNGKVNQYYNGYSGDIMVFKAAAWNGNYGHVAYVESSNPGSQWTVTHANATGMGSVSHTHIDKYQIDKSIFDKVKGSTNSNFWVKSITGTKQYQIYGFLGKN